ncbi:MAG: ubiquitin-like domain-containing protein, partial [Anaerolineae bacterium]
MMPPPSERPPTPRPHGGGARRDSAVGRRGPSSQTPCLEGVTFLALVAAAALAYHLSPAHVDLVVDGGRRSVTTRAATVGDLLIEQKVSVLPGDLVTPGPGSHLGRSAQVVVRRAREVRLQVGGQIVRLR